MEATYEDDITKIAVDSMGNLYGTGYTASSDFIHTNAFQVANAGGTYDAFAFKLNATGTNIVYSTYLGGNNVDEGFGIDVDTSGNAYIVGETYSANFPVTNALQNLVNGNGNTSTSDGFLTKLSPTGQLLYSSFFGRV